MRHLLLQPISKITFHSASGDVTEASVGDANSTNNVTDFARIEQITITVLFDDPRSVTPSAVMTAGCLP